MTWPRAGTALCARHGCRSKAGHQPTQRNTVNVGSVRETLMLGNAEHGQGQRRLMPCERGGGPVVVGGRESRPQGEGDQ
jgi:hypothetical protein